MAPLYARFVALLVVLLFPVVLYSVLAAYGAYSEGQSQTQDTVRQLGELAASQEETLIASAEKLLITLIRTDALPVSLLHGPDCSERIAGVQKIFEEYDYFAITDGAGRILCSSLAAALGTDVSDRAWWRHARDSGEVVVSDLGPSKLTGATVVTVAAPLGGPSPDQRLVMFIGIDVRDISLITRASGLAHEAVVYLLDRTGQVVIGDSLVSAEGLSAADLHDRPLLYGVPADLLKDAIKGDITRFTGRGLDGIERIYSANPLRGTNLLVLVGLPESRLLGWARRDLLRSAVVPLAMMLWTLLATALASHFMVARGLHSLSGVAQALRRGDYSARAELTAGPRELRDLADTLSSLARRVEQHEQTLSRSIEQKEAMLKEIHHRIKNNLQVVTSLMSLQAGRLRDPGAKAALADLQRRVRSLSLLHRHLYEGDDLRYLDFGQFVTELCQMVKESSGPQAQDIAVEVDMPPIPVSPDRAVPIALLITEALSNALRHAFPGDRHGRVRISLSATADATATVTIADDGVGWAAASSSATSSDSSPGMGVSLMQVFARQLGSELTIDGPPGTRIRFSFSLG